jgi:xanthine dehydrogenase YagR molybdenum-binding subunit
MASAAYPVFRMAAEAVVRIEPDGRAVVRCGTQDLGTGTYTVLGQLAAEALGIELNRVSVELGDTRLPEGPRSGGSMATASFTPAVERAARDLRRRLIELAIDNGPLQSLKPDEIMLEDGCVRSAAGNRSESLVDLLARSAPQGLEVAARTEPDLTMAFSACAYGAVFAEVAVDSELGEVRIIRLTAAYAAGRILNARLARSQYVGGLIGGIGMALHEATLMDARLGRIIGDNLADYLIPVHADMPDFDVHIVDEVDPHLAGGAKGIGMLGTVGTAAAIANAVFHATGQRIRDLPIRLEHARPIVTAGA